MGSSASAPKDCTKKDFDDSGIQDVGESFDGKRHQGDGEPQHGDGTSDPVLSECRICRAVFNSDEEVTVHWEEAHKRRKLDSVPQLSSKVAESPRKKIKRYLAEQNVTAKKQKKEKPLLHLPEGKREEREKGGALARRKAVAKKQKPVLQVAETKGDEGRILASREVTAEKSLENDKKNDNQEQCTENEKNDQVLGVKEVRKNKCQSVTPDLGKHLVLAHGPTAEDLETRSDNKEYKRTGKWYNRNVFKCEYCGDQSDTYKWKIKHVKPGRCSLSVKELGKGKVKRISNFKVKCKVCHESLLHDLDTLASHMRHRHKLTIVTYQNTYLKNRAEGASLTDKPSTNIPVPAAIIITQKSVNVIDTEEKGLWYDRNVFKCKYCSEQSNTYNWLSKHQSPGQCTLSAEEQGGGKVKVISKYRVECKVCKKSVLHHYLALSEHIQKHHNLTMVAYYNTYLLTNEEKVCAKDKPAPSDPVTFASRTMHHEINVGREGEETAKWYNKNLFKCQYCGKQSRTYGWLKKHYKSWNCPLSPDELGKGRPKRISNHQLKCRICEKSLSHDYVALRWHMSQAHQLSMSAYSNTYSNLSKSSIDKKTTAKEVSSNDEKSAASVPVPMALITRHEHTKTPDMKQKTLRWFDGNTFKCKRCGEQSEDYRSRKTHGRGSNKCTFSAEKFNNKFVRITLQKYTCKICGVTVFHDRDAIECHLRRIHKTNIKPYAETYESGTEPKVATEKCTNNLDSGQNTEAKKDGSKKPVKAHITFLSPYPAQTARDVVGVKDPLTVNSKGKAATDNEGKAATDNKRKAATDKVGKAATDNEDNAATDNEGIACGICGDIVKVDFMEHLDNKHARRISLGTKKLLRLDGRVV
jgi:hypothetical protein